MGTFRINGVDVLDTYGMQIYDFREAPSPSAKARLDDGKPEFQEKRISFDWNLKPSDGLTTTMHSYLEQIAELVGVHGSTQKEVLIEQLYGETSSAASAYICILESFDIQPQRPIRIQDVVLGTMTFVVVAVVDPSGVTTRTISLTGVASFQRNFYFADTNCRQGATNPIITFQSSASTPTLGLQALAVESDLVYLHGYSKGGNVILQSGQFGNPAADFEASGSYLSYSSAQAFGLSGDNHATIVIKLKRAYTGSDATNKYLFGESGAPISLHIAATTQNLVLTYPGSSLTISPGSLGISDSLWNTIIVRLDPSISGGVSLELYVNGTAAASSTATISSSGSTSGTLYIGNSTAGTNPCKCYISEFGIYKQPLTATQAAALAALTTPIADARIHDLNRNLTFLLDMSDGFTGRANRPAGIQLVNAITSTDLITLDTKRRTVRKFVKASGAYSDISNEITFLSGYSDNLIVQKFNKWFALVPASGTATLTMAYQGLRRR